LEACRGDTTRPGECEVWVKSLVQPLHDEGAVLIA
jgi:hypothetical protein